MTRKHFITIAAEIKLSVMANSNDHAVYMVLANMVARLCDKFAAENPAFNRVIFTRACGIID